ncbi:MAG: type II toxin-antitoxin system HigA family antitoxin [Parvibaculaceae bacterium]
MRNIRAIRNEADYGWALNEIARYFQNQPAPGTEAAERFDVLASLIEAYEARHWPIEPTDPIDEIENPVQTVPPCKPVISSSPRRSCA